jgi:Ca2+/Na+ antiporter
MWQNTVNIIGVISGIITIYLFILKLYPYYKKEKTVKQETYRQNYTKRLKWKYLTIEQKNEKLKPYGIIFAIIGGLITLAIVIKLISFLPNTTDDAKIASGILLGIPLGALIALGIFVFITEELQKIIDGDV